MARPKRLGLMLWPAPGLDAGFERGLWAESAGYGDLWLPDAEGLQDPLAMAAALGVATSRVRLCTGIVPAFNRPPPLLATAVVAAAERAPGRVVLGLGSSTSNMIERWYGLEYRKPLTRVRETLLLLRQIFAGEKTAFNGVTVRSEGFRLKALPPAPVPLYIGAIGPEMLALAGELADGVLLNDFTPPDRLDWALAQVERGAKRSGRSVDDIEIVKRRGLLLTDDEQAGLDYFRDYLGFYGSAPAYQTIMERLGYEAAVAEIRAGYAERNRARIAAAISDDMVRRISGFGDEARVQDLVRRDFTAGVDTLVISPQGGEAAQFLRGAAAFSAASFALPQ